MDQLHSDLRIEILARLNHSTLLEFCLANKFYYSIFMGDRLWKVKTQILDGESLVKYNQKLTPVKISERQNYFRNLILKGRYLPVSRLIENIKLLRLALVNGDLPRFNKYMKFGTPYDISIIGNLALHMKRFEFVEAIINSNRTNPYMLKLELTLIRGEPSDVMEFAMGSKVPNLDDGINEYEFIVRYSIQKNGFDRAKEICSEFLSPDTLNIYLGCGAVSLGLNVSELSIRWESFWPIKRLLRALSFSGNLKAFEFITGYLKAHKLDIKFILYLLPILSSDNPIFAYIANTYPDIIYENFERITINYCLQDIPVWKFIVEHCNTELLKKLAFTGFSEFREGPDPDRDMEEHQIILRELAKRI